MILAGFWRTQPKRVAGIIVIVTARAVFQSQPSLDNQFHHVYNACSGIDTVRVDCGSHAAVPLKGYRAGAAVKLLRLLMSGR